MPYVKFGWSIYVCTYVHVHTHICTYICTYIGNRYSVLYILYICMHVYCYVQYSTAQYRLKVTLKSRVNPGYNVSNWIASN